MQYSDILKEIAQGTFRPVYIIDSSELFFREELFHCLAERFLQNEGANSLSFNAHETNHRDIISELTTGSLFSPRQIIKVSGGLEFLSLNSKWFEEYMDSMESFQDLSNVLFIEDDFSAYNKSKARTETLKLLKKLDKKHDIFVKTPAIKKYDIPRWLVSRASSRYGIKIGRNEADLIIENTGTELKRIDMELDKIATFILPRSKVTADDINQLCLFNRENTIFEMLDAMSTGNMNAALKYTRHLLVTGTSPVNGVYMIFWHIKRLLQASLMVSQRIPHEEIISEIGINAYFKKKFFSQVEHFTLEQLQTAMHLSQKADTLSKTGSDPERTLERLIIVLCTMDRQSASVPQLL